MLIPNLIIQDKLVIEDLGLSHMYVWILSEKQELFYVNIKDLINNENSKTLI